MREKFSAKKDLRNFKQEKSKEEKITLDKEKERILELADSVLENLRVGGKEKNNQLKKEDIINLIKKLEISSGEEIDGFSNLHYQLDGTLAGSVRMPGWIVVPFKGDKVVMKIGGREVSNAQYVHSQKDGTLAGRVSPLGWITNVPFKGNKLIEKIEGREIDDAEDIHSQPDGSLVGRVKIDDSRWLPFKGNKLLEKIGDREIKNCRNIRSQDNGLITGEAQLSDGKWLHFIWDGRKIEK